MAAEGQRRFLVGDLGDLAETKPALVDDQIGEGVDRVEGPERANRVPQAAGLGATEHQVRRDALEQPRQRADIDRVLLDLVEDEVDKELARFDPVEIDPGDPVDPPERVEDPRLEELVVLRQIDALGGDPSLDDRDVVGVEREDEDRPDVLGKHRLHLVHLFRDLHPDDVDLLAPGELHEELGAVGVGGGVELLDAREGGEDLLHRFGDLLLDLARMRVGVGDLDEHERRVELRKERQRQAIEGDAADQEDAHQDHGRRDRPANRECRQIHESLPFSSQARRREDAKRSRRHLR